MEERKKESESKLWIRMDLEGEFYLSSYILLYYLYLYVHVKKYNINWITWHMSYKEKSIQMTIHFSWFSNLKVSFLIP